MAESIYPKIDVSPSVTVNDLVESKLSKSRATEIRMKVDELKKDLAHYHKLHKKWKHAHAILRGVSVAVGVAAGTTIVVTASLASSGIAIPALVPAVIAGVGVAEGVVSGGIGFGLMKKKIRKFNEKCNTISMYVNRLYHFYHKAIDDGKISIEEMEEYSILIHEYESAISDISTKHDSTTMHMDRIKHKALKEAEAECESELLEHFKDNVKKELKTKLFQNQN
jgi:hypothetical protein